MEGLLSMEPTPSSLHNRKDSQLEEGNMFPIESITKPKQSKDT